MSKVIVKNIKLPEGIIIKEFVVDIKSDNISKLTIEQWSELAARWLIKTCDDDYIRSRDTLEKVFDDVMASQRENVG